VEPPDRPVGVDTVFEHFPASVRGAIVIRGEDPEPHQIRLERTSVIDPRGRAVHDIPLTETVVDISPRGEILVPFDIPFATLEPGWYGVSAGVLVDGQSRVRGPEAGKRFLVPWPGDQVRRGPVEAGLALGAGRTVGRVECRSDRATVRWHAPAGDRGELRVVAEGERLPELSGTPDPNLEDRATVVYPVLKRHRKLTFELHAPGTAIRKATMNLP
jgi:hypothetical protein